VTRRTPIIALGAAAAIVIAILGLAVSPFLHHEHSAVQTTVVDAQLSPSQLDEITTIATIAATRALACHPPSPTPPSPTGKPRGWCGGFTLTREEPACAAATRCQVDLIGVFTSPDTSTVIALTVTMQPSTAGAWQATAVNS
jgi:hypothetical protein